MRTVNCSHTVLCGYTVRASKSLLVTYSYIVTTGCAGSNVSNIGKVIQECGHLCNGHFVLSASGNTSQKSSY